MAEKNSLWKNIRKKAEQNRRTGATPKKPTAEMLKQERKIKAKQYPDGGTIIDPRGQWAHPGKRTIVPSPTGQITMQGVPYPVYGEDETGYGQIMYPNNEYQFPGKMIDETPIKMQGGGPARPTIWDPKKAWFFGRERNSKSSIDLPGIGVDNGKLDPTTQWALDNWDILPLDKKNELINLSKKDVGTRFENFLNDAANPALSLLFAAGTAYGYKKVRENPHIIENIKKFPKRIYNRFSDWIHGSKDITFDNGGFIYQNQPIDNEKQKLINWYNHPETKYRLVNQFKKATHDLPVKDLLFNKGPEDLNERRIQRTEESLENALSGLEETITNAPIMLNPTQDEFNEYKYSQPLKYQKEIDKTLKKHPQAFTGPDGKIVILNPNEQILNYKTDSLQNQNKPDMSKYLEYDDSEKKVHELIHRASIKTSIGDTHLDELMKDKFPAPKNNSVINEWTKNKRELYPFLMQLRLKNDFKPGEIITPERLQEIKKSGYNNHLFRYYDDAELSKILNTLASNKQQSPYKQYAAQGGYLYQGGGEIGPVKLSERSWYNTNTGEIKTALTSPDNKTWQEVEFDINGNPTVGMIKHQLPEVEISADSPDYDSQGFRKKIEGDALEYVPIESALLPSDLPIKAVTTLGKIGKFGLEAINPAEGFRNLKELERNITINALNSKPALAVRKKILDELKNRSNVNQSVFDPKSLEKLKSTGFIIGKEGKLFSNDAVNIFGSYPGRGELRNYLINKYLRNKKYSKSLFNFKKDNFVADVILPEGDIPGTLDNFSFMDKSKISAGRTAKQLEELSENIPGKWDFNPGSLSGDSFPMWINLLNRKKDGNKFGVSVSSKFDHLNSYGRFSPISEALKKGDFEKGAKLISETVNPLFEKLNYQEGIDLFNSLSIYPSVSGVYYPNITLHKKYLQGGKINPYMYYAGGPIEYGKGGNFLKHVGAGAYAIAEGALDTITMGATDQLTDKGFEWLTKVGNKNMDLSDPKNAKFLKTQQQIKGYGNTAAAITTGIVTGNVKGAVSQSAKGLNTAFQASDWASDDFKKWSQGISSGVQFASGFMGGNPTSAVSSATSGANAASTASQASNVASSIGKGSNIANKAFNFGQKATDASKYINQVSGMIGGNEQPLWQQAEARQDYLNSPEYLAMKDEQNQEYLNRNFNNFITPTSPNLNFAATGGDINNLVTLQNPYSMKDRYKTYKTKYSKGGNIQDKLEANGIVKIPSYVGYHFEHPDGGQAMGPNASVERDELVQLSGGGHAGMGTPEYVYPADVNNIANTNPEEGIYMPKMTSDYKMITDKYGMPRFTKKSPAKWLEEKLNRGSEFRIEVDGPKKESNDQAMAMAKGGREVAVSVNDLKQQAAQEDAMRIAMADNVAAYGGYLSKYRNLSMPHSSGGKLPKEVLRARVEAHMSPEAANAYVENYAKGGSIHIKESKKGTFTAAMVKKANFARNAAKRKHAEGGPMVSNVQQPFEVAAQNRGGMLMDYANGGYVYQPMVQPMLAEGGNMYNVGGPVLDRLKRLLRLNQTGPSSLSHSQLNELMKDGNQQSESSNFNQPDNFKFKRIIGIDDNTGEPIYENKLSLPQNYTPKVNNLQINNPTTPNNFPRTNTGPGITYSMPNESIIPNEEILPSTTSLTSEIPDGTFQGVNMSGQDVSVRPEFREIYNKGLWKPEGEQTSPYLINQPNQPNQGLTGLDYASMGMQALGPLSQLYYGLQGGDDVNYQRVGVEKIDPTVAIVLANEEARRAQDLAGYNLRQNAPTSGSYMANMGALGLRASKQRAAQTAATRFEADKVNTDLVNRANALNAQIAMQEQIDRLQEKDAARTNVTEGLSGIGSTTANVIRDYRTNQINQMIANNIGTNDYKFDPTTNTITYRNQQGKLVTLPIETVVPPNIQANVGTGQIQKKGQSQFNLNFDRDLMKQFRKSFNQTSNKP